MISAVVIFSVFLTTLNGENLFQQQAASNKRLTDTGAGPTPRSVRQYGEPGAFVPNNQHMERYTIPPITKNLDYRSERDTGYMQHDSGGYNTGSYGHYHQHDHNNPHGFIDSYYDDSSEQQYGRPRSIHYPQTVPPNGGVDKPKFTTDRHYRDTKPANSFNITLVPIKKNATGNKNTNNDQHRMVYPSDTEANKTFHKFRQTPATNLPSAKNNCSYGLCDDVDEYPEEKILSIIGRSKELQQYFSKLALDTSEFVNNRFGDDEDTMCSTRVHTQFPRSAPNTNHEERILVNVGEYKQGIVYETCASDGAACKYSDLFPNNYSTSCKQKYTIRRLMAVGKDTDKAVFDNFHLPSCCVCVIKKN